VTTTLTHQYISRLLDRFDELKARRERHGGSLGPSEQIEYDRAAEEIERCCAELDGEKP
jgi:hypothetical protein